MPQRSSRPAHPSHTAHLDHPTWDAALRPAQRRAELGRARLKQRRLAEAGRRRIITTWLRELANRKAGVTAAHREVPGSGAVRASEERRGG